MTKFQINFPLTEEEYLQTKETIAFIRQAPTAKESYTKLHDLIQVLTHAGIEYFFHYSLKSVGLGGFIIAAVKTGLRATENTIKLLSKRFVKKLTEEQMMQGVDFIDAFIEEREE